MLDEFLEFVKSRACMNAPHKYPDNRINEIVEFENAAYIQGFTDAISLMAFLPRN